jgi:hypothetical protein
MKEDALDLRGAADALPQALIDGLHEAAEIQVMPHRDLDRVLDTEPVARFKEISLEKGRIGAHLDDWWRRQRPAQSGDRGPQEVAGTIRILHVAGPITMVKRLSRLRDRRGDRVVARILPVVRVVAAKRARNGQSRREHTAIDVDGEPWKGLLLDHVGGAHENETVDLVEVDLAKCSETTSKRPSTRHAPQSRDAMDERIVAEEFDMSQSTAAHKEHRHDEQHERDEAKVATPRQAMLASPKMRGKAAVPQIAAEQLQSGVRRQALLTELDPQVALDSAQPTVADVMRGIARLGGHHKSNGPRGWQLLWAGFQDLLTWGAGFIAGRSITSSDHS